MSPENLPCRESVKMNYRRHVRLAKVKEVMGINLSRELKLPHYNSSEFKYNHNSELPLAPTHITISIKTLINQG
jgi:hypothetical protein